MRRARPAPSAPVAARSAVATVFFLNGFAFAGWVSRIPESRTALGLSPGQLGTLLLALAAGSVFALPATGPVLTRVGTARVVASAAAVGGLGLALAAIGVGTVSVPATAAGLFLAGLGSGGWDVAMNVEGARVERALRRFVMPRLHAGFSLGTVAGALLGATAAALAVPVPVHLVAVAVVVAVAPAFAVRGFLGAGGEGPGATGAAGTRRHPLHAWTEPRTLVIGLMVLALAFTEGVANDWLAVALVDGHGVPPAVGAAAFALFVAAMTTGRLAGSALLQRWGRLPVLRASMVLAGVGVVLVVVADWLPVVAVGVVLWGAGASLGFPVGMSAAADDPAQAAARVSVVSSIGYTAFLVGPPLIGFLGDRGGTLPSLLVVAVLLLPSLLATGAARPLPTGPPVDPVG